MKKAIQSLPTSWIFIILISLISKGEIKSQDFSLIELNRMVKTSSAAIVNNAIEEKGYNLVDKIEDEYLDVKETYYTYSSETSGSYCGYYVTDDGKREVGFCPDSKLDYIAIVKEASDNPNYKFLSSDKTIIKYDSEGNFIASGNNFFITTLYEIEYEDSYLMVSFKEYLRPISSRITHNISVYYQFEVVMSYYY